MRDPLFSLPRPASSRWPGMEKLMHFDLRKIGLPEVPFLGAQEVLRSRKGVGEHIHDGAMEFCYLIHGEQVWHVEGRDYRIRGNEIFLTYPDEPHGSGKNQTGKGRLYWFHLYLPGKNKTFLTLDAREAAPLVRALRHLPRRSFRADPRLQTIYEDIITTFLAPDMPLKKLRVATLLLEWLQIVIECAHAAEAPSHTPDIQRVLDHCRKRIDENLTLPEMAGVAGLSLPRFKAKFKQQVGIAPMEYFMRAKVDQAGNLLKDPRHSVTDVAYQLGFSSSQYFATVFKRFTNHRPRDCRGTGERTERTESVG